MNESEREAKRERPILMSAEMVRAILDGRKTQTRRVVKGDHDRLDPIHEGEPPFYFEHGKKCEGGCDYSCRGIRQIESPFGQPGDLLWVKETFWPVQDVGNANGHNRHIYYRASEVHPNTPRKGWKPSIHMPRWASRLTLEIVNVRVERLRDVTPSDAKAEGFDGQVHFVSNWDSMEHAWDFTRTFYGAAPWIENPWVWVIEFRRVKPCCSIVAADSIRARAKKVG